MDRSLGLNILAAGRCGACVQGDHVDRPLGTKHTGSWQVWCLCTRRRRGQIPGNKPTTIYLLNILAAVRWGCFVYKETTRTELSDQNRGGSLKKLSLAGLARLSWLRYSCLRFGLASVGYCGLRVHDRPVYTAG